MTLKLTPQHSRYKPPPPRVVQKDAAHKTSQETETLFNCAMRSALEADQLRERLTLALEACAEYREKLDKANVEVAQLKNALELGQENCDAEYERLREELDEAQADTRLLDSGEILLGLNGSEWHFTRINLRAAIAAAQQEAK